MKVTVVPSSQAELKHWQQRLDEAGVFFEITVKGRKPAIVLDAADAEYILGIKPKKGMPVWKKAIAV